VFTVPALRCRGNGATRTQLSRLEPSSDFKDLSLRGSAAEHLAFRAFASEHLFFRAFILAEYLILSELPTYHHMRIWRGYDRSELLHAGAELWCSESFCSDVFDFECRCFVNVRNGSNFTYILGNNKCAFGSPYLRPSDQLIQFVLTYAHSHPCIYTHRIHFRS
jgi:hypothetical protein